MKNEAVRLLKPCLEQFFIPFLASATFTPEGVILNGLQPHNCHLRLRDIARIKHQRPEHIISNIHTQGLNKPLLCQLRIHPIG